MFAKNAYVVLNGENVSKGASMSGINVLVVGGGGREYELARQLGNSSRVDKVFVAPGNAGTDKLPKTQNVTSGATNITGITVFVQEHGVSSVIVGPEAPLVAGLTNALRAINIDVFGPSQAAAQLEASKAFAAAFMARHDIPQPS